MRWVTLRNRFRGFRVRGSTLIHSIRKAIHFAASTIAPINLSARRGCDYGPSAYRPNHHGRPLARDSGSRRMGKNHRARGTTQEESHFSREDPSIHRAGRFQYSSTVISEPSTALSWNSTRRPQAGKSAGWSSRRCTGAWASRPCSCAP